MHNLTKKIFFLFLLIVLLFSFNACKEKECEKNIDCFKKGYTGICKENKCQFNPIPNFCGNGICEKDENKCTCSTDCGPCSGVVKGTKNLVQKCINNECSQDVSATNPISYNKDINYGGDSFDANVLFNQPFNLKKDKLKLSLMLSSQNKKNKEEFIKNVEITAKTTDGRTVVIARKDINKYLWISGSKIEEELILDFPSNKLEGELKNLVLTINYEYISKSYSKTTKKNGALKMTLSNIKFIYVSPNIKYPCPDSCDDNNPATRDYCDPITHFCMQDYIDNVCGNFKCEENENKCICPIDCGPCEGDIGDYLTLKCELNECNAKLKTAEVEVKSVLDERNIGPIKLINNYIYDIPFNVNEDKFQLKFELYSLPEEVSNVKIETVRILSGTDEIGKVQPKKRITEQGIEVDVLVKEISDFEEENAINLKIWYEYTKNEETIKGSYTKSLGKIIFINPK